MSGSWIDVPLGSGDAMPAYFARAEIAARGGVVLLQEIFGINANMRMIADDFASHGYDAIAPDLFWRQQPRLELDPSQPGDRDRASTLMKGLDQSLAVEDALAAARKLREVGSAAGAVCAVGYCLGGKLAYLLATRPGIDGAVAYYGVAIHSALDQAASIRCPLLLHIALEDHLCPPAARQAIHAALDGRPNVTIIDHPGVGHAFARRGDATFNAAAAERADQATAEFLKRVGDGTS